MKLIAIGDIHGRSTWKEIVEVEHDADRIVFIGDYFDSFNIPVIDQLVNFREIVALKQKYPEKVVLLIGNHDFHYMPYAPGERYSGYSEAYAREIWLNLKEILSQMQIIHIERFASVNYLFSHAGVTQSWLEVAQESIGTINDMNPVKLSFDSEDKSGYGQSIYQSPIWVRPESLVMDVAEDENYVQVVGHTRQPNVKYYEGEYAARVILIDCHDTVPEYLIIEDGKPRTGSLQN